MAKKVSKRVKKPSPPSSLTMRLYTPGMSILHRAGLGGLACTLAWLKKEYRGGYLQGREDEMVPGHPWPDDQPPWEIGQTEIRLDFGRPEAAREYLKRLFTYAFQIRDGLIYLPGQYEGGQTANIEVRAYLQQGMTLTFLQHGRVRKLAKDETTYAYEIDGQTIDVSYKQCSDYKHSEGWKDLVDKQGRLTSKRVQVVGPLNPGAVVRHVAFSSATRIEEPVQTILPLYFALVGCLTLSVNRGSGVLLVPDVADLGTFIELRPWMTPRTARDCQITGASDAVLQAQIRIRAKQAAADGESPGCFAAMFRPTPWASQQKSRVHTVHVPPGREIKLELFERVMAIPELAPRPVTKTDAEIKGRGKAKQTIERKETFWVDSAVRPLIAENIAEGRPWYEGFHKLMIGIDPASKKPNHEKLVFEKKGLHAMTQEAPWEEEGERTVVEAVHEALGRRYGQIADENKGNPAAMKNRWKGEYDRWRLAFAGAKTSEQFRKAFCDLLSRAPGRGVLKEHWADLLPMLSEQRWMLARDLALLGLASYASKDADDDSGNENNQSAA